MSSKIIFVDPITFEISENDPEKAAEKIKSVIKRIASEIKSSDPIKAITEFSEKFYEELINKDSIFSKIPSDTRYPGFMSSLADHLIMTSAFAVALAEQAISENINLADGYENTKLHQILSDNKNIKQIVRFIALLHDIGKPLPKHYQKTNEIIKELLTSMKFDEKLASIIALSASRHHYGRYYQDYDKPHTRLEWILAYADKLAVQDRSSIPKRPKEANAALKWLKESTNLTEDQVKALNEIVEFFDNNADKLENEKIDRNNVPDSLIEKDLSKKLELESEIRKDRLNLGEKPLAVLLLETAGIQSFISLSEAMKYLQGSSAILEKAMNAAAQAVAKELVPESIVYVGGGSLFAIVPASKYEKILNKAIKAFRKIAGDRPSLKIVPEDYAKFTMFDIKNGPLFVWQAWNNMKKVDTRDMILVSTGFIYKYLTIHSARQLGHIPKFSTGPDDVCKICYSEESVDPKNKKEYEKIVKYFKEDDKDFKIGESCYEVLKFQKGLSKDKSDIIKNPENLKHNIGALETLSKTMKILRKKLEEMKIRQNISYNIPYLDNVYSFINDGDGSKSYPMAIIAGDGDNFGSIKEEMTNFTQYKYISDKFKTAIQDTLAKTLADILLRQIEINNYPEKLTLPFQIIYVGGDDFLLVLDPRAIPLFISGLKKHLSEFFGDTKTKYTKNKEQPLSRQFLGISMGIAIGKSNSPLFLMLESVRLLEAKAKEYSKAWQSKHKPLFGSEITVALHRFANVPNKQEVIEKFTSKIGDSNITTWPMIGEEILNSKGIFQKTKELLKYGLNANDLKSYLKLNERNIIGVEIVLNYAAARNKKKNQNENEKWKGYNELSKSIFITKNNSKAITIYDIHELMKIINNNPEFLEGIFNGHLE